MKLKLNLKISALWLFAILVFWRVGLAEYVQWDDPVFILNNPLLKEPFGSFIQQIFSHYFFGDLIPITLLSFWVEVQIWGAQPEAQHIFNLVLHLLNIALLFLYLRKLPISEGAAFFITAVFAVHPVQTEVVMWISERKSLLALFFALLAMHASQKVAREKIFGRAWLGYGIFFTLSLLSKSTALLLPVLLLASDKLFFKNTWRFVLKKHFLPFVLALAWGLVRILAYSESVSDPGQITWNLDRIQNLPFQIISALGFYLEKFFVPLQLSIIYPPYAGVQNIFWSLVAILFFSSFILFAFKKKNPQIFYFLILVILFLLPVLQIVPRINFVNDRYLYFPVVGFAGLLTTLAPAWLKNAKLAILIILIFGIVAFQRSEVWISNFNLWQDTVEKNSASGLAQNNFGLALLKEKQINPALSHFEIGAQIGRKDGTAHLSLHNLGMIYFSQEWPTLKNAAKAESYYLQSVQASPKDSAESQLNLALLYAETQRPKEAISLLSRLETDLSERKDQQKQGLLLLTRKILTELKK